MTEPRARPPAPLPGRARAMLVAYREAHELPPEVEERIWSVVGTDDAPEPAFDPLADEAEEAPRTGRRWLGYAGATLAAAAMLVLAWRMGGTLAERRQAERTQDAAVMQGGGSSSQGHAVTPSPRAATTAARDASTAAEPSPTDAPPTTATPEPLAEPAPAEPSTRPRPSSSTPAERPSSSSPPSGSPPGPAASPSTFAAERELVAEAWRALALGDHAQALQAAAEHARRFPAGLLVPERAAIETIAHCRQDPQGGPRRASAFHRAHPRSPLATRVDEACEKKSPTP